MTKTDTELYKTKDLGLAGALLTMKRELVKVEREKDICWFLFNKKQRCEEIAHQFLFSTLMLDAQDYYNNLNVLKKLIFENK